MKLTSLTLAMSVMLATTSYAAPYIGLQIGMASIKGAKATIDNGVKRLSIGYALPLNNQFRLLAEVGVTDGMTFDAGQLGSFKVDHVQVHMGSSIDGLLGAGFQAGPILWSALGGMQSSKLSTNAMAAQDTLSKTQPLVSLRAQYVLNKNVTIGITLNHTFGKSGDIYTFDSALDTVTLNHVPSMTAVYIGVSLSL